MNASIVPRLWNSDSPYHNPCEEKNINIPAERTRFYGKLKNLSAHNRSGVGERGESKGSKARLKKAFFFLRCEKMDGVDFIMLARFWTRMFCSRCV